MTDSEIVFVRTAGSRPYQITCMLIVQAHPQPRYDFLTIAFSAVSMPIAQGKAQLKPLAEIWNINNMMTISGPKEVSPHPNSAFVFTENSFPRC